MVLKSIGFLELFCGWVLNVLRSAKISMLVNGSLVRSFSCSYSVHHGDPMYMHLFGLVENFLSRYLSHLVRTNTTVPMSSSRNMYAYSHLLYADDVLFFL